MLSLIKKRLVDQKTKCMTSAVTICIAVFLGAQAGGKQVSNSFKKDNLKLELSERALSCPTGDWKHSLVIHHFDVGQGDSTFFRTPSGTTILIDAGMPAPGVDVVVPTIKKCYGLRALDYVVLTHFHKDHFGGMSAVFNNFIVRKAVLDPGDGAIPSNKKDNNAIFAYQVFANKTGKRRTPELNDNTIVTGDESKFQIVAAGGRVRGISHTIGRPSDENSMSIAIKVTYGSFNYFTGGDLTGGGNGTPDLESKVASVVGHVDVMKADHHGSNTSNNSHFLQVLKPEQVVISVGNGGLNRNYHLPNSNVITRMFLQKSIENIFQTETGEGAAPKEVLSKVRSLGSDVIIVAAKNSYAINGHEFKTDEITSGRLAFNQIAESDKVVEIGAKRVETAIGNQVACCKMCSKGKACGDTCIKQTYTCHKEPGCACNL